MHHFEASVMVDRPVDEVWALVGDLTRVPEYDPHVLRSAPVGAERGVGARYAQAVKIPGASCRSVTAQVVAYEPGRRVAFESRCGSVEVSGALRVEPRGGQTYLTFSGDLALHGLSRLGAPMIRHAVERHARDNLARIRALLEGGSARASRAA